MSGNQAVETLQARITEAESAYHRLMSGKAMRVVVDQNGERMEFTSVSAAQLYGYIVRLKAELAALTGGPPPVVSRPLGFVF